MSSGEVRGGGGGVALAPCHNLSVNFLDLSLLNFNNNNYILCKHINCIISYLIVIDNYEINKTIFSKDLLLLQCMIFNYTC